MSEMLSQGKNIERIDRYLREEMTSVERNQFEVDLKEDNILKEELEFVRDAQKSLEKKEITRLKNVLKQSDLNNKRNWSALTFLKIAASVLIVAALGYYFLQSQTVDYNAVYQAHYEPYPNIVDPLSRSGQLNGSNPFQLYEQAHYKEALAMLTNKQPKSDTVYFYLAQTQMAVGNAQAALAQFNSINDSKSIFYEPARWYVALLYIKTDDIDRAEDLLGKIIENSENYAERARKLKAEL